MTTIADSMTSEQYLEMQRLASALPAADLPTEMTAEEFLVYQEQRHGRDVVLSRGQQVKVSSADAPKTSTALEDFQEWLLFASPCPVETEYAGAIPGRNFRFDWYVPELKISFEYDGVIDHGSERGSERDAMKSNLAQLEGILFIRVNSRSIRNGTAYHVAEQAFKRRGATLKGTKHGTDH